MRRCIVPLLIQLLLSSLSIITVAEEQVSVPEEYDVNCRDEEKECPGWARLGECENNPNYMLHYCRLSCQQCVGPTNSNDADNDVNQMQVAGTCSAEDQECDANCKDEDENCSEWADGGECEKNPGYMLNSCRLSCEQCIGPVIYEDDVEQDIIVGTKKEQMKIAEVVDKMNEYIETVVNADPKYSRIRGSCVNKESSCAYWAATGSCEDHFSYMVSNCPKACMICDQLDVKLRCPVPETDEHDAYKPGDLNAMFYRIANGEFDQYLPVIHSAPGDYVRTNQTSIVDDSNVRLGGPWIVTFDDFVSDDEADRMISYGYEQGYERSLDVGSKNADGTYGDLESTGRTSENAWCQDDCYTDPKIYAIEQRIMEITDVPSLNHEYFQILRYEHNQFYEQHHDYIEFQNKRPCGPRILTFFLYLSDVEEGGGTKFNELDIVITPKKGRALLWPSVLSDDP
eukprot:CAMPEP_0116021144 /NCGR_PEP_ID=MMETSP0321-20121206/10212_1 /TAXON_ID=163516 /ORGANISM="Leptocylindrus danicus var. danicus, Strain B650" /LENGTH=455 /DNA_ID=CAMNT_0003491959 /DNA_START=156 /DNA_END=1520 /DNA_ORIENTATION=+